MLVLTGANGHLGRAVVAALAARVGPTFAVSVRDAARAGDLAAQGVAVREADYDDADRLARAFDGAEALLLISGDAPAPVRIAQHRRAVDAAVRAGVGRVVYTSVQDVGADSPFPFAAIHRDTEAYLAASGVPTTVLRNGVYAETSLLFAGPAAASGTLAMPTGAGRVAFVARPDLAEAAAAALADDRHAGRTYTLTGPAAYDYGAVAAVVGRAAGRAVVHADVPPAEFSAGLAAAGLPGFVVEAMAGMAAAIRDGRFAAVTGDVAALTGRTPADGLAVLEDALRAPASSGAEPVGA